MVAAGLGLAIAVLGGSAAKFAAPNDQGVFKHAALLEIGHQGAERLVDFAGALGQAGFNILVMVPAAGPDLDEADAAFEQAAGNEHLAALGGVAVKFLDVLRLAAEIEGVGGGGLHFEGDFVGFDAGFELGVLLEILGVQFVELLDQIQLPALFGFGNIGAADVFDHLVHAAGGGVDIGALVNAGQEGRAPILGAAGREAAAAVQGNETGHVLVLTAQPVKSPRTQARLGYLARAGVHHDGGDFVRRECR